MFKKGQAAMEFLMTYGWAILVVLAAIGALAYFGVLSPDNLLPERTSFQAPIPNVDSAVVTIVSDTQATIAIAFSNGVGQTITPEEGTPTTAGKIQNFIIDGTTIVCTSIDTDSNLASVSNAETFVYTWTCNAAADTFDASAMANKRVKADLSFQYTNTATTQDKSASGNINGKVSA